MITVTETKDYTAKKAALCWVLKELKFLVKDIDQFIEKYDDVRIAVCNQAIGTDFPTSCDLKYHDATDRAIARYIMMCSDPFEIVNLYKADYIKASISNTPAIDAAFEKISEQIQSVPYLTPTGRKNKIDKIMSLMQTYDTESRLGVSRFTLAAILSKIEGGHTPYTYIRNGVILCNYTGFGNPKEFVCQCGSTKSTDRTQNCYICGSSTSYDYKSELTLIMEQNEHEADFYEKIIATLSPKDPVNEYDDCMNAILLILKLNISIPMKPEQMLLVTNHISQYLVCVANNNSTIKNEYAELTRNTMFDPIYIDDFNRVIAKLGLNYCIEIDDEYLHVATRDSEEFGNKYNLAQVRCRVRRAIPNSTDFLDKWALYRSYRDVYKLFTSNTVPKDMRYIADSLVKPKEFINNIDANLEAFNNAISLSGKRLAYTTFTGGKEYYFITR